MYEQVSFVVDRFNAMLSGDGSSLEVDSLTDGVLHLRYKKGQAGECASCVLEPADLEALIGEALGGKAADVTAVEVVVA